MSKGKILFIAESPAAQRTLAEEVIEPRGYRHLQALGGNEGLNIMQGYGADLIILDDEIPDRDAFVLLKQIQEDYADVPVIFTSAVQSTSSILRVFRLGASDFVAKPYDQDEMADAIRRTLVTDRAGHSKQRSLTRQLREANQQLQRQLQELNTLFAIGRAVTSLLDLDQVLSRVVEAATYTIGAEEGTLMLLDNETNELYLRAAKDVNERTARNLRLRVDDSAAGQSLRSGQPVHLTGNSVKVATGYLVKSLLYVPLRTPSRGTIGVLGVANRRADKAFSERDISLVSALADYAAVAIENARLFKNAEAERVKLEAVLREAEEAILVADENNRILLCNAAARDIWDLADQRLSLRSVEEVIPTPAVKDLFTQGLEENRGIHREVTVSNERTYNAQLTPVPGVGRVLVMQDITHLKELDRLKSEFVATVSHDLRTPLTSIQGYVELLPRVGPLNERQEQFVGRVEESLANITNLINDLLDIRRIEAELDLEMEPFDLRDLIDEVVEDLEPQASEKEQDLRWDRPEGLRLVRGNSRRLRQAMINLVGNAIKYTQEGGWIAITARKDNGHVVVEVSDNGIGIPHSQQPQVFDKFYRVESEDTENIRGTGLGLAIVRAVIEKHNGRVWVESTPGKGSIFSFVLPALEEQS